jgi:hypothetical protein
VINPRRAGAVLVLFLSIVPALKAEDKLPLEKIHLPAGFPY